MFIQLAYNIRSQLSNTVTYESTATKKIMSDETKQSTQSACFRINTIIVW